MAGLVNSLPVQDAALWYCRPTTTGRPEPSIGSGPRSGFRVPTAVTTPTRSGVPPPDCPTARAVGDVVIAVGITPQNLAASFGSVQKAARIDNTIGEDNDEQGQTVWMAVSTAVLDTIVATPCHFG